ncbi:MAG: hypothetical protein R3C28_09765 [Pirellulaceae bacterium]
MIQRVAQQSGEKAPVSGDPCANIWKPTKRLKHWVVGQCGHVLMWCNCGVQDADTTSQD